MKKPLTPLRWKIMSTELMDSSLNDSEEEYGNVMRVEAGKWIEEIEALKQRESAIILAHNYQRPEVQDIADFLGDSLELSQKAKATKARVIVFCGVHFMAETAALLSPDKTVLLPDRDAGCPMADMVDAEGVRALRQKHPDAMVVCYVNSSAAVKAVSDVCCTSANAADIVASLPVDRETIFIPDQYLGMHIERITGRKLILWPGYCPTHARIQPEHVVRAREAYEGALVLVHPECRPEVAALADQVLSTGGMCRLASTTEAKTVIVGTETGLIHRLAAENPHKHFVPLLDEALCPNMKRITLEKIAHSLKTFEYRVEVPDPIAKYARAAILAMFDPGARSSGTSGHG